jgi:hypothetical protein
MQAGLTIESCRGDVRYPRRDYVHRRVSILADSPEFADNHTTRVVLEAGIYGSHIVWRIRYRRVIKEAKTSGKTVDEILEPEGDGCDVESGDAPNQPAKEPSEKMDTDEGERGRESGLEGPGSRIDNVEDG